MNELTRRDEFSLAGAALRGAPWKAAAITGAAGAATSFGLGAILPGPADLHWALSLGVALFTLVATVGAVSKPDVSDRVTRNARLWSLRNPWRFALYPGIGSAVLLYPLNLVLDGDGMIGSAWDGLWGGAIIYLIAGLLTTVFKGRATR
ncbi:hypothetical protein SAMN05421505_13064 [Sinosporangium album]|uniref:Uncharacterized protein n=1 Tax=Sinosporangium album TaxID=504805 RepID=A0A1G8H4M1_9ACTN|nr:hypothetical protein [Sinosporangium album]SDI01607.1 hypothetical protein SAMN05421505_13064 [Sinosporangium album]